MSRVSRAFRISSGPVLAAVTALAMALSAPQAFAGPKHHHGYSSGSVYAPAVGGFSPAGRPAGRSYSPTRYGYKLHRRPNVRNSGVRHSIRHRNVRHGRHTIRRNHHRHGAYAHGSAVLPQVHNGSGVILGSGHMRPAGSSYRNKRYHPGYHARFFGGGQGAAPVYYGPNTSYGSGSVTGNVAIVVGSQQSGGGSYVAPGETYLEEACKPGEYCSLRLGPGSNAPKIITFNDSGKPIN